MQIDVDKLVADAVQKLLPWSLTIKVGGEEYSVRPLTVADVAAAEQIQKSVAAESDPGRLEELARAMFDLITGWFAEPRPDLAKLTGDQMQAVLGSIMLYLAKKKSEAIVRATKAAVEAARS